jgi:SAM-dependent methyltransferase
MKKTQSSKKQEFISEFEASVISKAFVKLVLSMSGSGANAQKVIVDIFVKADDFRFSINSLLPDRSLTKTMTLKETVEMLNVELVRNYSAAVLFSSVNDINFVVNRNGVESMSVSPPTKIASQESPHNRKKNYLIKEDEDYLVALGVSNSKGRVVGAAYSKYRQIAKFIEIVDSHLSVAALAKKDLISVLDVGSGKGYLTFALYSFLSQKFDVSIDVKGVDTKTDMVEKCNKIATGLGFSGLQFINKSIGDFEREKLDIVVALHACDTATDHAIFHGISSNAQHIFCAPCCQHEISTQLKKSNTENASLISHGLFLQKQADLVTDVSRTLLLESAGYKVKVLEFVSSEHSTKNTLIVASKGINSGKINRKYQEYISLKMAFGFRQHTLADLLDAEWNQKGEFYR